MLCSTSDSDVQDVRKGEGNNRTISPHGRNLNQGPGPAAEHVHSRASRSVSRFLICLPPFPLRCSAA